VTDQGAAHPPESAPAGGSGNDVFLAEHVSKTFGGEPALDDVSLNVRFGEIHGLMGENGSGKSTFVKIMSGFHQPDSEVTASFGGSDLSLGDATAAHDAGIRFVHQDLGLIDTFSTVENIGLARGFSTSKGKIRWRHERKRAEEAIGLLGYDFNVLESIDRLGATEQTVVAVARALDEPEGTIRLLVMDEPTSSLPGAEAARLFKVVHKVRDRGIGVIVVSHHLDEVLDNADRITVLRDGRRVDTLDRSEVDRDRLIELMTASPASAATSSATWT